MQQNAQQDGLYAGRDQELVALEEELQKALGTKVRIMASKKRGKIVIDYYSLQDLERILKKFTK